MVGCLSCQVMSTTTNTKECCAVSEQDLCFVKCESCGSLIPSTAKRCRMCGFKLEPVSREPNVETEVASKSRVKQRTMSLSSDAVETYKQNFEEQLSSTREVLSYEPPEDTTAVTHTEGKIEEKSEHVTTPGQGRSDAVAGGMSPRSGLRFRSKPLAQPSVGESPKSVSGNDQSDDVESSDYGKTDDETARIPTEEVERSKPAMSPSPEKQPRKADMGSHSAGVQFTHGDKSSTPVDVPKVADRQLESSDSDVRHDSNTQQETRSTEGRNRRKKRKKNRRLETDDRGLSGSGPELEAEVPHEVKDTSERVGDGDKREVPVRKNGFADRSGLPSCIPSGDTELVGWLLSYHDGHIESVVQIREGRFLVTRERLRPSDMALEDNSIATPHAIFKVSVDDGMQVVDLMSESGTFIKKVGDKSYAQHTQQVMLGHGDWLKFGSCEFLVCLVPRGEASGE